MSRAAVLAGALLLGATVAAAQATADTLAQAQRLYEELEIERALPLLRRLASPDWPFEVSPDQRTDIYLYLGASLALLGRSDSAVTAFRRAIEQNAFAQLDQQRFTPAQLALFAQARRRTLAVGARPVRPGRYDPRTERIMFAVVTSHAARLRVELRRPGSAAPGVLFSGDADGPRDVPWDGLAGGTLAPPGRYELVVSGLSRVLPREDSARVYFDLQHVVAPLEDTL
ncbi:MAG: hypothetical protein ACREMV_14355, partial [Gemmatimonadales bacterium]